jgi:hypothetical protein
MSEWGEVSQCLCLLICVLMCAMDVQANGNRLRSKMSLVTILFKFHVATITAVH